MTTTIKLRWSAMTKSQHLNAAQELFDKHEGTNVNGLHRDIIKAQAHVAAAQVVARR